MKNKKEILESIDLVIGGINEIIITPELLKSTEERVKEKIPAFTSHCPFRDYYKLTEDTLTYPFSTRKFNKHFLKIRLSFWIKLYQIIDFHKFREKDRIADILQFTIKEADVITFNKFNKT